MTGMPRLPAHLPWATTGDDAALSNPILLSFQTTLDSLISPVFIKNRDGRYIACNQAFEAYIGLPRDKIIGASVYDVAPAELARVYEQADKELMARGGTQIYEASVRYADGTLHDIMFQKSVFCDAQGKVEGISGVMLDITERKSLERQLAHAAATDFLTGINNLRTFYELGGQEFRRFQRSNNQLTLMLIDVDDFKSINDTLGHAAGDEALCRIVEQIRDKLRDQDILARAGGDEFRILLPDTPVSGAAVLAERIRLSVGELSVISERGRRGLSISVGISTCQPEDIDLDDVTRRADEALYRAKANGRNCIERIAD